MTKRTPTMTSYASATGFDATHVAILFLGGAILALLGIALYAELTGLPQPCVRVERAGLSVSYEDTALLVRLPLHNYCSREARLTRITVETRTGLRVYHMNMDIPAGATRSILIRVPAESNITLHLSYLVGDHTVSEELTLN